MPTAPVTLHAHSNTDRFANNLEVVPMPFTLLVNGEPREVDVPSDTPLMWVLRDTLGLTGTKFGCGMALCGACTVHLNGNPVPSCEIAVSDAVGLPIITIEGLSPDGSHPVQLA